jgi:hypothetical protein
MVRRWSPWVLAAPLVFQFDWDLWNRAGAMSSTNQVTVECVESGDRRIDESGDRQDAIALSQA